MKKSDKYFLAIAAVMDSCLSASDKIELVEILMEDRRFALYSEKLEEEKQTVSTLSKGVII